MINRHLHRFKTHFFLVLSLGFASLLFIFYIGNFYFEKFNPPIGINFGVSFSPETALSLGLDWQKTYLDILQNLKVKRVRIPTYWWTIEPQKDVFDFSQTDFMIQNAQQTKTKVLLVIGYKQPGWPECRSPAWTLPLDQKQRQNELLKYITQTVNRYKNDDVIWGYQVENEPLLKFGDNCDEPDRKFLAKEVATVKSLDSAKPIVITDSGELRPWRTPMRLSDVLGVTLYRSVYDKFFGYFYYPIPPAFYHFKSDAARLFFAPKNQRTVISELQAEPWSSIPLSEVPIEKQVKLFPVSQLTDNIKFGTGTGFDEIYLWGVEWWYFMKAQGHPEYLETVASIFR